VTKEALIDPSQQTPTASPAGAVTSLTMAQVKGDLTGHAVANTKVRVLAVLCWSELVDGKWTAAKTSDIERPSLVGTFTAAGAGAFDRSGVRLYTAESTHGLWLWTNHGGSFLLYNTHSLPVRGEDVTWDSGDPLSSSSRSRDAWVNAGTTLKADYYDYDGDVFEEREILTMPIGGRVVDPTHPLLESWVAPMVIEDRRHVFYVRTAHKAVSIAETGGHVDPAVPFVIPKLVETPDYRKPDPIGPVADVRFDKLGPLINPVRDQSELTVFVTEDAHIRTGIASRNPVAFDGASFGMRGQVPTRAYGVTTRRQS
jgi:hypothetical protein